MARARGANALFNAAFEGAYGVPPANGYIKLPFVSSALGEEQGLLASDLLGYGREPQDPSEDAADNVGDVVVPMDVRNFGYWLKLLLGAPVTVATVAASAVIPWTAQPAANSTFTPNGTAFTFVAAGPVGNQVLIGANLAATIANLAVALNASAVGGVAQATYVAGATALTITNDALGPVGNAYTLAAAATSGAKLPSATLTNGANTHTFTSGAVALPSMSMEIGMPEVPSYGMQFGGRADSLKVSMTRKGLLNATLSLICQGEAVSAATATGEDPVDELAVERLAQAIGQISQNGVQLASIVSSDFTYANNLDKVEVIRPDSRIEDADPGMVAMTGTITARFRDTSLLDMAQAQQASALSFGWSKSAGKSLLVNVPRVFLPKAKRPVTGPGGVQATFPWQAAIDAVAGNSATFALTNDVAGY